MPADPATVTFLQNRIAVLDASIVENSRRRDLLSQQAIATNNEYFHEAVKGFDQIIDLIGQEKALHQQRLTRELQKG